MLSFAIAGLLFAIGPSAARADEGFTHVVRPGETLASIAQRYYGDPRRESVLVAENGLAAQGGAPIVVGLRLTVPWVRYHRVRAGETWPQLAERFYGDPRRAFVLQDANHTGTEQSPEGAELLVPYPVRHVCGQNETLGRVATLYYASEEEGVRRLRRFNNLRLSRVTRGQVVLVPLSDLVLSEEGCRVIEAETGASPAAGEVRSLQQRIEEQLPTLRAHVLAGRFTEAVALGNNLIGAGELTGNQLVSISRELGTAYVALDRMDLAIEAFRAALERQPDLHLDSRDTSPTVLEAMARARAPRGGRAEAREPGAQATERSTPPAREHARGQQ
ncbi:MAG: LysM peptidoglycan-binding domain-containing protein [Polyangiaceae bacterium]|nr:LysM peptidoglycan-binding domain-containing protein [Polyangiaceae bacterium]